MSNRVSVKAVSGSMALSTGNFVYTAISALGSVIIARLLGLADYGVISIALIYPIMFSGLADLGLSTAVMRYASLGDLKSAFTALWLRLTMSLLFAIALVPLAPYLATMLQRPYLTPMIYVLANMLIGLPITWILLVRYGMLGAVVASVVNNVIGTAISLTVVRRMYSVNIKVMNVIKYLIPSLIAGSLTYSITCMVKGLWLTLGIGSVLYLVLLVMLMVVVVSKEDLMHLANTSRSIEYIGPIISYTLNAVVKIKMLLCRRWI